MGYLPARGLSHCRLGVRSRENGKDNSPGPLEAVVTSTSANRFLPVIYHDIATSGAGPNRLDAENRPYRIARETFDSHLRILHRNGYKSVTSDQILEHVRGGGQIPRRSVLITFDDGHASNYTDAMPLLEQYGYKGVFFITTEWVGTPGMLTWDRILEMADRGMEIGSHTVTHPIPPLLTRRALKEELVGSRAQIEHRLGRNVLSASSPTGFHDTRMRELSAEAGYQILYVGITSPFGRTLEGEDPYWLNRIDIKSCLPVQQFQRLVEGKGSTEFRMRTKEYVLGISKTLLGPSLYNRVRKEILTRSA